MCSLHKGLHMLLKAGTKGKSPRPDKVCTGEYITQNLIILKKIIRYTGRTTR